MENKNTYQRLLNAQKQIGSTTIKKAGRNAFSKYDYFTPSQITNLVIGACVDNGLIGTATIDRTTLENGNSQYSGIYTVRNVDAPDEFPIVFTIPSELPELKATNAAQKLGGLVTYVNRYLQMLAFSISEDSLDLDDKDNTNPKEVKTSPKSQKLKEITEDQFKSCVSKLVEGTAKYTKTDVLNGYNLTDVQKKIINTI